ncbi:MAG: TetR/AcrR family transcriptional regulator [Proteobacteria bacterium]|nr:TetR/AcrR family transcriptional regulator [Pseudomonadota bacterium]
MEKAKRKEREFNLRRADILDAAVKTFAAKGFHSATVAEIAAASGFAIGSLYQFFESKEQLYTAMLTEKLGMMYAGIRAVVEEESDIIRKIELLVASHFRYVEENAEFCSIFVRGDYLALSEGTAELRTRMRSDYARHVAFIEEVMADGMRTGVLKEMDAPMMAAALMGIVNSYASKWIALAEAKSLTKKTPFVLAIFLEGVRSNAR